MGHDTLHQPTPGGGPARRGRAAWWVVAMSVHLLGALTFVYWPKAERPQPLPATATSAAHRPLLLADQQQALQKARAARRKSAQKAPPQPVQPAPKPEILRGQIVEVAPSTTTKTPKEARYLAEHDSATEHETRSRHSPQPEGNIMHEPTRQTDKAQISPRAQKPVDIQAPLLAQKADEGPQTAKMVAETAAKLPSQIRKHQDRLALQRNDLLEGLHNQAASRATPQNAPQLPIEPHLGGPRASPSPQAGLTMADLIPSIGVLARLSGGPSDDALQDVDEGEGTFLNAREFKYAAYFMRIKRGVAQRWHAAEEYQRRDPTGNIYGYKSRTTGVHVTLDRDGGLKTVAVAQSSGVDFLDQAALSAFQTAAPFPNPPKALLDAAEEVRFTFGFVFSIGRQGFFAAP